jgi:hypothetical protein
MDHEFRIELDFNCGTQWLAISAYCGSSMMWAQNQIEVLGNVITGPELHPGPNVG